MYKLIERAVAAQLSEHIHSEGLFEVFLSVYATGSSTETALVKVQNDILMAVESH